MNLVEAVKAAGVVGAGGAGFPTNVKLDAKADVFIVNAAECEPLIETDKFLCRSFAREIIEGTELIAGHLGAERRVIALKGKYKDEIRALEEAISELSSNVEIFKMGEFYPAGDEQTLVYEVCGVSVPERGIPLNVGVVVDNVGTVINVKAAEKEIPVTDKYLSVVGSVKTPLMLNVPIGTGIRECIEKAKPEFEDYAVIVGGPMMGKIIIDDQEIHNTYITKTTGNLIVLPRDHYLIRHWEMPLEKIRHTAKSACIQCRMCTDLCPRYLIGHKIRPHHVMRNFWREPAIEDNDEFLRCFGDSANCCDCGACEMFSCPMGLSPKRVNVYLKGKLRERGLNPDRNMAPESREEISHRRIPISRLVARLGLTGLYGRYSGSECERLNPETVYIHFSQHIGKPAVPVKSDGDKVSKGELIARADESGLSANIHSSIDGVISEISAEGARITRQGVQ